MASFDQRRPSKGVSERRIWLAARQEGLPVCFITAAALFNERHEAHNEKRLLRLQRQLAGGRCRVAV